MQFGVLYGCVLVVLLGSTSGYVMERAMAASGNKGWKAVRFLPCMNVLDGCDRNHWNYCSNPLKYLGCFKKCTGCEEPTDANVNAGEFVMDHRVFRNSDWGLEMKVAGSENWTGVCPQHLDPELSIKWKEPEPPEQHDGPTPLPFGPEACRVVRETCGDRGDFAFRPRYTHSPHNRHRHGHGR